MAEESLSKQEIEEEGGPWSQLLPELLTRISLLAFRKGDVGVLAVIPSVCKSWNISMDLNLIRTSLRDPPLKTLSPLYPCLLTLKGTLCNFYHPHHTFTLDFPELSGFYIRFSKFGWLLLCSFSRNMDDLTYTYFFFNPFTRQKIDLPACDEEFFSMSFSSPPTSSHCFVIGMTWNYTFGITKRGDTKWEVTRSPKTKDQFTPYSHLALCGDCCYAIGDKGKIVVFDLKGKSLNFLGNPLYKDSSFNIKGKYLVENGAKLLAVMVPYEEQNIYIREMTPSKREWFPVETLRSKMLFISKTSSMLKPAPVRAASNKIYFPKILNGVTFVPYSLDTKKYISFLGDYASGSPWSSNVKQWTHCTWIETMPFAPAFACHEQIDW